jgi:hypothetical protein
MPEIDAKQLADLFARADAASTSPEKGRALEELIAYLFGCIPGLSVIARNVLDESGAQEVDIAFWNEKDANGLMFFDYVLLVECKNWSRPVGHPELTVFADKLRSRGRPQGILVATNGITGDSEDLSAAHRQISRELEAGREIIVLTRTEIETLNCTGDLILLLKRKCAMLAVSGTSI